MTGRSWGGAEMTGRRWEGAEMTGIRCIRLVVFYLMIVVCVGYARPTVSVYLGVPVHINY